MRNEHKLDTKTTIHTRPISSSEKAKMRRSHWILIPALLIPAFIIWVVSLVDDLPQPARIGAYVIGGGAVLVMCWKQFKLEKDLKNGKAEVIRGIIEDKIKFGGHNNRPSSGIGRAHKGSRSSATYILVIEGKKYWVKPKIYSRAEKGAFMEMVWLPASQYVISIQKI